MINATFVTWINMKCKRIDIFLCLHNKTDSAVLLRFASNFCLFLHVMSVYHASAAQK